VPRHDRLANSEGVDASLRLQGACPHPPDEKLCTRAVLPCRGRHVVAMKRRRMPSETPVGLTPRPRGHGSVVRTGTHSPPRRPQAGLRQRGAKPPQRV